jgi:hypothetical protein
MNETTSRSLKKRSANRIALAVGMIMLVAIVWMVGGVLNESSSEASRPTAASNAITSPPIVDTTHGNTTKKNLWGSDSRAASVAKTRDASEHATDLRAFFDGALKDPADGGLYYAKRVLLQCSTIMIDRSFPRATALHSGSPEQLAASLAAIDRQVARCNGLGDSASTAAFRAAMKSSVMDDPMEGMIAGERATREVGKQMSFEAAAAMVQRATDFGDPYLLRDGLLYLINAARMYDELVLDFDARRALSSATVLMPCDLGADCDDYVGACYRFGECAGIFQRVAEGRFVADGRQSFVEAEAELVNAAREGTLLGRYRK